MINVFNVFNVFVRVVVAHGVEIPSDAFDFGKMESTCTVTIEMDNSGVNVVVLALICFSGLMWLD